MTIPEHAGYTTFSPTVPDKPVVVSFSVIGEDRAGHKIVSRRKDVRSSSIVVLAILIPGIQWCQVHTILAIIVR